MRIMRIPEKEVIHMQDYIEHEMGFFEYSISGPQAGHYFFEFPGDLPEETFISIAFNLVRLEREIF